LDRLGLLAENENTGDEDVDSQTNSQGPKTLQRIDTMTSSAGSVGWSSTFDFNSNNTNKTPAVIVTNTAASAANIDFETYEMTYGCKDGFFSPATLQQRGDMEGESLYSQLEEPAFIDYEMGPAGVSFEDLEAMGNLMDQNQFMESALTQGGYNFNNGPQELTFGNQWLSAPVL